MPDVSRRNLAAATAAGGMLTASTAARSASFANPDEPLQGADSAKHNPASLNGLGRNTLHRQPVSCSPIFSGNRY